jgi:hypothetical protein
MEGLDKVKCIKVVYRGDEKTISSLNDLMPYLELICDHVNIVYSDRDSK